MKKIDVIVEARMTSTRLPGKILLESAGRPLLELMIERLKHFSLINDIIIATTTNISDNTIEDLANRNDVLCFRGSENDVLGRVLNAAHKFNTNIIVQITGDMVLTDKIISEKVINFFLNNQNDFDFVSNDASLYNDNYKQSFPNGFNTKVYTTALLAKVANETNHPVDREHVVNYILKNYKNYRIHNFEAENSYRRTDLRLTLDYPEDYKVINCIYEALYPINPNFTALDIFNFLDENPDIKKINANCTQAKYLY